MEALRNLSTKFNLALKTAASDNIINKKELDDLKSKAKTDDDKKVIQLFSKDNAKDVNFSVSRNKGEINYNLSLDLDSSPEKVVDMSKYQPINTSYNSLGEGDATKAVNVADQPAITKPIGSLDSLVNDFNTPEKVASLMGSIDYDKERGKPLGGDGPLGAEMPEKTLESFSGVCRDIHQVGAYLLSANGYEAIQMGYVGARTSHSLTVYKPPGGEGYGIVEYGKVYSPEQIKELLGGRYASSPEEALNALNFGGATAIYKWTPPKEGEVGHVEGIFYTQKHKNYHQTLQLEHKDKIVVDRNLGMELEKTLGENFSIKFGVKTDSPGDPTAAGSVHAAVGYKTGNEDNYFSVSLGTQYRANDGSRIVGTLDFLKNPTFLAGADIRGQVRPYKLEYLPKQFMTTTFSGNLSGAFLALNKEKETDAGAIVLKDSVGYDLDYVSGLADGKLGIDHRFYGQLGENFHYSAGAFANYDINLAVAAMSMGAKNPAAFTNVGLDAKVSYENGGFQAGIGGKYMLHQVSNLDNSGVGMDLSYDFGKVKLFTDATYMDSVEGSRLRTRQGIQWEATENLRLSAEASQEIIFSGDKAYTNPGGINGAVRASFSF